MRTLQAHITTFTLLAIAAPASAQLSAPIHYNEGPGVTLTEGLVFHPGVEVEGRYDSNPTLANEETGSPYMRLIAHLHLATLSPQRLTDGSGKVAQQQLEFRLESAFAYREYFNDDAAISEQRGLEIDAAMRTKWKPTRSFSLEVADNFSRAVTARNALVAQGDTIDQTIARDRNEVSATANITPGGGLLNVALGYSMLLDIFEESGINQANKLFHQISLLTTYRLLPQTAAMLEVMQQFSNYYNQTGSSLLNSESKPLRVSAGLSGLITPRLSLLLKAGFGHGFYDTGKSFKSIITWAELGYQIGPTARARIGFSRNFTDSPFANYYVDTTVYAGYDHLIMSRLVLRLQASYVYRTYEGFNALTGLGINDLDMNLATGTLGIDYKIRDWVYVGLGYDLMVQDITSAERDDVVGIVSYGRHQFYGKVGMSY